MKNIGVSRGMEEQGYEYWLFCLRGITNEKKCRLHKQGITAEELFHIEEIERKGGLEFLFTETERERIKSHRKEKDWEREFETIRKQGIQIITWKNPEYPDRWKQLKGMPYAICVKGELPKEEQITVGIVGSRNCTSYGEQMTLQFAESLAEAGVQVVSGMARGIDGAAHRGALNRGKETFAVLGCGTDVCYPREHRGLYRDILQQGGVISEYPPGTPPLPAHFPARNRLISGLSDVVLVMEAKEKSGSLITADMALEQGKDVYALPGPVNSEWSKGCNFLIRQGAGILLSVEDLIEELYIQKGNKELIRTKISENRKIVLERKENLVYSNLGLYPVSREELLVITGLNPQEISGILLSLQLKGYIKEKSKNYYVRQR